MTILVVGSTGTLGSLAARYARAVGHRVVGMVRDRQSPAAKHLCSAGISLRVADLKEPRQLNLAVQGVDSVIMTATATLSRRQGDSLEAVDGRGLQALITACVQAGVHHFVFVSFSRGIDADTPLSRFKRAAERRLENTAIESSILLPSYFPEKFMSPLVGFDMSKQRARIYGDGTRPINYVATADVAKVAALCAAGKQGHGAIPMGGPKAYSQLEIVEMAERIVENRLILDYLSLEEIESAMRAADDPLKQSHLGLYRGLALGDTPSIEWAEKFGLQPTSVEACFRRMWGFESLDRAS